jgi:hypothetical protein
LRSGTPKACQSQPEITIASRISYREADFPQPDSCEATPAAHSAFGHP